MKKQILKIAIVLAFVTSLISCSNNDEHIENTSWSSESQLKSGLTVEEIIVDDPEFVSYVVESYDFNNNILDFPKFRDAYNSIDQNSRTLTTEQEDEMTNALGLSTFTEYTDYLATQTARISNLEKNYGLSTQFTQDGRDRVITIVLERERPIIQPNGQCERRLRNCRNIAHSAAVAGHVACATVDITVIGGIICHGAVLNAHYAMLDNCQADYEDCIK